MRHLPRRLTVIVAALAAVLGTAGIAAGISLTSASASPSGGRVFSFHMVRSATAATARCLKGAAAFVTIRSVGPVEIMKVTAIHLPRNTDFDLFVIQVPNAPFGIGWYQGDLESNRFGQAHGTFVGRFSIETFAVAPGTAPAPQVFTRPPFPNAKFNPPFGPIQMYHLGLWFNSPRDAARARCPATVTPFNGEHNAGVQALSTRNFPTLFGPLRFVH
jgi:hypothetical protein